MGRMPSVLRSIEAVYKSRIYILLIVVIALVSLFCPLPVWLDLLIDGLFVLDLALGTILFIKTTSFLPELKRTPTAYLKHFFLDILACVPVAEFGILRIFRLFRIVRIAKLRKMNHQSFRVNWLNIFNFQTTREIAIWLLIYFVGNVYAFQQLEGQSLLDSVYWLVETATGVGYGDYRPTHSVTKLLAVCLMLISVAVVGYANGVITTTVVVHLNRDKAEDSAPAAHQELSADVCPAVDARPVDCDAPVQGPVAGARAAAASGQALPESARGGAGLAVKRLACSDPGAVTGSVGGRAANLTNGRAAGDGSYSVA